MYSVLIVGETDAMLALSAQQVKRFVLPSMMLAVGLALSAILLASLAGKASDTLAPPGTPEGDSVVYDTAFPATDEGRAMYGSIFIGVVAEKAGEEILPSSDPDFFTTSLLYDVDVEQSLRGEVSGRVRIKLYGTDFESVDFPDARELRVGERILFFGGFDPETGIYPVAAGRGTIPIKNDRDAADLVATFEPLIREEERRQDEPPPFDPCEESRESPVIVVEPSKGAPGDEVRLTGGPFIRPEAAVWWDGKEEFLTAAPIDANCSTDFSVTIPNAKSGQHRIIVEDAGGRTAEATFEVVGDGAGAAPCAKNAGQDANADKKDGREKHRRHR